MIERLTIWHFQITDVGCQSLRIGALCLLEDHDDHQECETSVGLLHISVHYSTDSSGDLKPPHLVSLSCNIKALITAPSLPSSAAGSVHDYSVMTKLMTLSRAWLCAHRLLPLD